MPGAIVGALAVATGTTALFGTAAALTGLGVIASGVIGIGLSLGLSYAANALFGEKPTSPRPQDVSGIIRQSVSARTRHYGRLKAGGSLVFIETENGNLHQLLVFGQGLIDAYETFYIDNNIYSLSGGDSGMAVDAPQNSRGVGIYPYRGSSTQSAVAMLIERFGTDVWSTAHQLKGLAYAHILARAVVQEDFSAVYPERIPQVNAVMRGVRVYDPRSGSTAWTANMALILRDYLTHADGARISSSLIDTDLFIAAANVCDEATGLKAGGSIPRYHGSLSYSFEADPASVIERILRAMDGRLFLTGEGKIGVLAGKWVATSVTISDDHILGYEITDGSGPFSASNIVIIKYTNPAKDYSEATSDPWRDEALIAEQGELSQSVDTYEVQHHNLARRLAKIIQHRNSPRWQITLRTNLHGLNAWDQRWIRVQISDAGIDETFEVLNVELDPGTMSVSLQLSSFGPDAYAFDPATEEGTAPAVPAPAPVFTLFPPAGVIWASSSRATGGGDLVAAILLSWDAKPRLDLQAEAQISPHGANAWTSIPVSQDDNTAEAVGVSAGAAYDLRVRYRGTGGRVSNWAMVENAVANAVDPTPAAQVTTVSADEDTGDIDVRWRGGNSANYRGAKIYLGTSSVFTSADLVATRYGAANTIDTFTIEGLDPDTYRVWVTAFNGSGIETTPPVSAGSVVVPVIEE